MRTFLRGLWEWPLAAPAAIVFAALLVVMAAWRAGGFESFELQAYDAFVRWRSTAAPPATPV
ncbi:MAG TPA: hypothetical protein VD965_12035, partial [Burkholderiales bacterium]|nr:hypothetical protein [Burkholderiales bacterium]